MASRVTALILLGLLCFQFTAAQVMSDCCLSTIDKRFPPKFVEKYVLQEAGQGCEISATVIITKAGRKLCLVHPEVNPWVQDFLADIDRRKHK